MQPFDFLADQPPYRDEPGPLRRLNRRHEMIVAPFAGQIAGARVLDLAAHDGRWSAALAQAGAAEVVGVEARAELIARFEGFPDAPWKGRVRMEKADLFDWLEAALARGERFDVVALYGIFYHVLEHFRLLRLVRALGPRLVIVDSEFRREKAPIIHLVQERTDKDLNAAPQIAGQERALIGVPSFTAMTQMARSAGFAISWTNPAAHFPEDRGSVQDYFRKGMMKRGVCALRPAELETAE